VVQIPGGLPGIPFLPPGTRVRCFLRVDASTGEAICLTHGLHFKSREEAGEHVKRMKKWRSRAAVRLKHYIRTFLGFMAMNPGRRGGEYDKKRTT